MKFESKTLGEVCSKIGSGATPKGGKEAYCSEGISIVRSQNVLDLQFSEAGLAFINDDQAKKLSNVEVLAGDVLLNITGDSVARCCKMNPDYLPARVNQHVCIIRGNPKYVLNDYLLYFLYLNKSHLLQLASAGATRNALTKGMLESFIIQLPSVENQHKVIFVLNALQYKIYLNQKINDHLEQQVQALFRKQFIDNPECQKWRSGTFSDLIERMIAGDWGKEAPTGNNTEMVYCIRGADIPEVSKGNKGKMPTRFILPKNYKAKHLADGDIVVEISGGSPTQSTGRVAAISQSLLDRYDRGMVCTNFCKAIKPISGYSMFVYYYWKFLYDKGVFFSYENGTTGIKNLDITGFIETEPVVIPPLSEVKPFNDFCHAVFNIIFANGLENERLGQLRDTLLPKLMSGEIDVSHIEI